MIFREEITTTCAFSLIAEAMPRQYDSGMREILVATIFWLVYPWNLMIPSFVALINQVPASALDIRDNLALSMTSNFL